MANVRHPWWPTAKSSVSVPPAVARAAGGRTLVLLKILGSDQARRSPTNLDSQDVAQDFPCLRSAGGGGRTQVPRVFIAIRVTWCHSRLINLVGFTWIQSDSLGFWSLSASGLKWTAAVSR